MLFIYINTCIPLAYVTKDLLLSGSEFLMLTSILDMNTWLSLACAQDK